MYQEQPTVADRKSEFVPVTGGGEGSDAGTLLIVAYVVMWALVFAGIWASLRRARALSLRVDDLESQLRAAELTSPPSTTESGTG